MSQKEIVEDFLEVDHPIPGQNFVCLSFVSPEKILEQKNVYYAHKYLEKNAEKYGLKLENLTKDFDDFVYDNKDEIEKEFYEKNDYQTTTRGVKVRGVYDTQREASVRAKVLQQKDRNFHVFVGQVGYWLPWDPCADDIEHEEHTDEQLNKLVKKYKENKKKKDIYYEEEKRKSKEKIIEDELKKKEQQEQEQQEQQEQQEEPEQQEQQEEQEEPEQQEQEQQEDTSSNLDKSSVNREESTINSTIFTEDDTWLKKKKEKVIDLDS